MKLIYNTNILCLTVIISIQSIITLSNDNELYDTPTQKYYVSPKGSDDNDGSLSAPWKSIDKVNEIVLKPGDSILFERGSEFEGSLYIKNSGTELNPITVSAYSEGKAPSFNNSNLLLNNGNIIQISGDHIIIDGLYFHDGVSADRSKGINARKIGAIYINESADYIVVKNCEFYDCPLGIQIYGQHSLITNNFIHDCNRFLSEPSWGPIGIMVATSNHEISYNRIENMVKVGGTFGADGGAIEIDKYENIHENIEIHHNYSYGNEGFLEIIKGKTENVRVHHNISCDYQQFIFFWSGKNCYVENNTVLCTLPRNSRVRVVFSFADDSVMVRNNIFVVNNGLQVFAGDSDEVYGMDRYNQPHSHNIYYSIDNSVSNPCGKPLGNGDIITDPKFVSIDELNLHLMENSPAIDAGIILGYTKDFNDNPIPVGTAPDIGAYEFDIER